MADAMQFIRKQAEAKKPFFAYIPTAVPHAAMHAPRALHEKWRKAFPRFDEKIGRYGAGAGETCPPVKNPIAGFAAMMENLDNQVGEVLALLKELGVEDSTIVLFASDNGAHHEGGHDLDFWDSNGPFRGIKRDLYEGGIRSPFFVRWPGTIQPGSTSSHISAFWDVLPTMAELTGQPVPEQNTGISFLPTLTGHGEAQTKHDFLYWEFTKGAAQTIDKRALRQGDWKVLQRYRRGKKGPVELYNLKDDLSESQDLAKEKPDLVDRLTALMDEAHTPLPE